MAEIINLKQFRKQKQRDEKAKAADENRAKFGRSKAEKQKSDLVTQNEKAKFDAHILDKSGDDKDV